ncbi:putative tail tubular protein B [Pseudomonas phage LKA1]|uniref:Putative tail tubular protein B n=1 Tax=Pseudomonas phage LKA1 TaxID=386793 RepID=Q0E5W9_9CAUD|nr:putative tail tubular protein B [Pseudomonas phage LKA1]CAK25013.1 putative tail tubular protein B [Pseudomonas phage LKA1]
MSYFAGSYRQLLFGVSQQTAKDRLEGQVESQLNMQSDLVTGPRRRSPVHLIADAMAATDANRLAYSLATFSGREVLLLVDTLDGTLTILDDATGEVLFTGTNSYLTAGTGRSIRFAALDDSVFVANTEVIPQTQLWSGASAYPDPTRAGYLYVVAGAFSKQYRLSITNQVTGVTTSVDVTTSATEASQATGEYVITQLRTAAEADATIGTAAGFAYYQDGAYLYVTAPEAIAVSTDSGSNFLRASNAASIRDAAELPAKLPADADGFIIATGAAKNKTYFRWVDLERKWDEDASRGAQAELIDMPLRITYSAPNFSLTALNYERRASGDATSNPALKFTEQGISGMTTMQGRLVLLAGEYVCMSASGNPLRWFRASVSTQSDDDPIEVAATAPVASPYEYAVAFNKDLVLFAKTHQGLVPGANLLTSRNATAAVVTEYSFQNSCSPVVAGRTVFFASPRSGPWSAVWEMLPSQYTDAQVEASDSTSHLPKYIAGPVRFLATSSTTSIVVVGTSNLRELVVHEYLWQGGEKVHAAWHKWSFPQDITGAYFRGDRLILLFHVAGRVILGELFMQRLGDAQSIPGGFLDLYRVGAANADEEVAIPAFAADLYPEDSTFAYKLSGEFQSLGQRCGDRRVDGATVYIKVVGAQAGDQYRIGLRYLSKLGPTRPILRDPNGVPITTERTQLHRLTWSLDSTGEVTFRVADQARGESAYTTTPLRLYSRDLGAGLPLAATATLDTPARVDMQTAQFSLETDDYYDMNITSLEYGFRYNQRYRRQ